MITDLNKILIEWSYRTSDGQPDVNNSAKLLILESVLNDFGWSREARAELLSTLMTEDDIVKHKDSGNVYTVKNVNKDKHILVKKNASEDEIEKAEKGEKDDDEKDTEKKKTKGDKPEEHEKWKKERSNTNELVSKSQKEIINDVFTITKAGDGPGGIAGGPSSGLMNEAASVHKETVNSAEKKLGDVGILDSSKSSSEQLNDLNDNYEKAVDTVVEDLLNNKDFMESDLAKKSVLSHNKDGTLKSTSKAKLKRIAGTIVGNKKAILQAEEKHNWDSNLTETDRYIGSDNQLQDAADHVSDFVKRNGKDAVLLTRQGSRIPFFKEDGTPNRMKYKNKKGEIVEGTIEEIVRHQIINSGAGENAGDTILLSENSAKSNELLFHNTSNKTDTDDQISHSTPAEDLNKRKNEVDRLEKSKIISKDVAKKARDIMERGAARKQQSDKDLKTSTEKASKTLKSKIDEDSKKKAILQHAFDNNLVPNVKYKDEPNWPDTKKEHHWRKPGRSENVGDARIKSINKKYGSLGGFIEAMQNQDQMGRNVRGEDGKPTGEKTGPTGEELKIMERLSSRVKHWDEQPEGSTETNSLDVPKEIQKHRETWITADEEEHEELNKIKIKNKIKYIDEDGNEREIENESGMGDIVLAEEVAEMTHYHFADDDYEDQILKETSMTNNGGTNVDGKTLKECLGVDNKSQFLGGFRKGNTTQQRDSEGNLTGLIVTEMAIILQKNDNPPPPFKQEEVVIAEKRYRSTGGKTDKLASVGKWSPEIKKCFESGRAK